MVAVAQIGRPPKAWGTRTRISRQITGPVPPRICTTSRFPRSCPTAKGLCNSHHASEHWQVRRSRDPVTGTRRRGAESSCPTCLGNFRVMSLLARPVLWISAACVALCLLLLVVLDPSVADLKDLGVPSIVGAIVGALIAHFAARRSREEHELSLDVLTLQDDRGEARSARRSSRATDSCECRFNQCPLACFITTGKTGFTHVPDASGVTISRNAS